MPGPSKAAAEPGGKLTPRTPRPLLTAAELQAILDHTGPIDPQDQAETDAMFANAVYAAPGTPPGAIIAALHARRPGERGPQKAPTKVQIALRVTADTLDRWKATGPGWMTRMDEWLAQGPV